MAGSTGWWWKAADVARRCLLVGFDSVAGAVAAPLHQKAPGQPEILKLIQRRVFTADFNPGFENPHTLFKADTEHVRIRLHLNHNPDR